MQKGIILIGWLEDNYLYETKEDLDKKEYYYHREKLSYQFEEFNGKKIRIIIEELE